MPKNVVICADPPWAFDDKLTMSDVKRGAQSHYPVLDINAIAALNVAALAAEKSVLALWCPSVMIEDGLHVIKSWGFKYKQICVWPKGRLGLGHLFRNKHEIALIATRGQYTKILKNHAQTTMLPIEDHKHSQKPESLQDRLELMFDGPYLELFARRQRPGWTCVGNESDTTRDEDIRDTITRMLMEDANTQEITE